MSDLLLLDNNVDFVATYYVAEGWDKWISSPFIDKVYNIENMHEFLDECALKLIFPFGKLFKKEILEKFRLQFDQNLYYGEDTLFVYTYLRYIKSARVTSKKMYHYICNSGCSLSNKRYSWDFYSNLINLLCDTLDILEKSFVWDSFSVRYVCIRDIYKLYLDSLKNDNLFRTIGKLRSVCENRNVLENLKHSLNKDLTLKRRIFNILLINKMYLFCAMILSYYKKM